MFKIFDIISINEISEINERNDGNRNDKFEDQKRNELNCAQSLQFIKNKLLAR